MHTSLHDKKSFQELIYKHYRIYGRRFPWRETTDPYHILVSEIMLQQTQAERVQDFYTRFIQRFPDVDSLAKSRVGDVVRIWKGLGYNRRALNLRRAAHDIVSKFEGPIPNALSDLEALPGVGPYTARAILAFAFNAPSAFIETNIRTVYLHFFFKKRRRVSDNELLPLVQETLDQENPRLWYQALMDYGAMLKRSSVRLNSKSPQYVKQEPFLGSTRELRGKLIALALEKPITRQNLKKFLGKEDRGLPVERVLGALITEGFLKKQGRTYLLR